MSDVITKIKSAADIVEIISESLPLKRSGANYLGLCPFHKDSKPSMYVSPSKQIFKCFSCDTGGDVLKFWSEYHKKSFAESIQDLARRYGIPLDYNPESKARDEKSSLAIKMHELAADYYVDKLLGSQEAQHCRDYLNTRGITTETIHKFKIGYSPSDKQDWAKLTHHLKDKFTVSDEQCFEAGLTSRSDKDPAKPIYYDRFRGRLMVAIRDERGKVIAFGARALVNPETGTEPSPKYLNSSDSEIYTKGDHLYALDLAREAIHKEDAAIVVEGYFDVISLHQAGITNVVANQGTALTQKQAKLLCKHTESKRIYLCFDTDKAGEDATERAIETIMQVSAGVGAEIRIIRVSGGKDPDELVRQGGADAFRELVKSAPLIFDYQINRIIAEAKDSSPQSKSRCITKIAKYLSFIKNKVEQSEYIRLIAGKLDLQDESALREQFKDEMDTNPYKRAENLKPAIARNKHIMYLPKSLSSTERELLMICLINRKLLEDFLASAQTLVSTEHQTILDALVDVSFENPDLNDVDAKFRELQNKLSDKQELSKILTDLGMALDDEVRKPSDELRFADAVKRLNREKLKLELEQINIEITDLSKSNDTAKEQLWDALDHKKKKLKQELERCR